MRCLLIAVPHSQCGSSTITPECKICVLQNGCEAARKAKSLEVVGTSKA